MKQFAAAVGLFVVIGMYACDIAAAQQVADPTPVLIKQRVEDLLSKPVFGTKRDGYTYNYRNWDEAEDKYEPPDVDFSWIEWLVNWFEWLGWFASTVVWSFEVILWTLLIALVVLILVFHNRWLPYLRVKRPPPAVTLPSALFGKEAARDPLPDDIVGKAWERWQQGDARGCLSLLYRGALLRIILSRRIQLRDSATEEDCLREIIPLESPERATYFQSLTRWWQTTAYAARAPAQLQAEQLVAGWRQHFGESK